MRLLHTSKLTLCEFFGNKIPRYAILSHRWENDEVTFRDLSDRKGSQMAGWAKITGCCAQAILDGWEYVWIDTCCIDKTSSAELSEAINSMFGWYEQAEVCYAYLSDVPSATEDPSLRLSSFRRSQWFKRGWTLQELLAPCYVDFFDRNWNWIGSKAILNDSIRDITKVANLTNYKEASVAQKMSWASGRVTTRIEDIAYCLLGLFGVHMPPLYGEGKNAFLRLQLEIINKTDDDSIFAWDHSTFDGPGLFASMPFSFSGSSNIVRYVWDPERPPPTMSSKGLCVHFPLVPNDNSYKLGTPDGKHHFALLNCRLSRINRAIDDKKVLALPIYQSNAFKGTSEWVRDIYPLEQFDLNDIDYKPGGNVKRDMLYARQTSEAPIRSFDSGEENVRRIQLNICSLHDSGFRIEKYAIQKLRAFWEVDVEGPSLTVNEDWVRDDSQVSIILANDKLEGLAIVLGMSNGHLWVDLLILDTKEVFQDTWHGFWSRKKLLVGRDRISRPFLHGSLNARIENCGGWGSRARLRQVIEVIFDPRGTLRWPVRQTTSFLEFKDTLCVTE